MRQIMTVAVATALLSACSTYQSPPPAMLAMPNDCANIEAYNNWLEKQSHLARAPLQNERNHDQIRSQFRHRLWTVRYNCRPV
jgi:hypothetical protein